MIAEESSLAKNEVQRVRGGRKAGVLREAINTDQARIVWGGSVEIDKMAGARVNAITANQERAFGCGPVLESGNHSSVQTSGDSLKMGQAHPPVGPAFARCWLLGAGCR